MRTLQIFEPRHPVLFIFIDGIGIGAADPQVNPIVAASRRILNFSRESLGPLPHGGLCIPTDATLGCPGIPQSATGQTSIFTGQNAPQLAGRHIQGFPTKELRELIARQSLFKKLADSGFRVTFANAYTPRFFKQRPRWVSVTTVMCESSGIPLRQVDEVLSGRGLYMDFSNGLLQRMGIDAPARSPEDAAKVLTSLAKDYDLCLYEFFLTDLVGHRGDFRQALDLLARVDEFLHCVLSGLDLTRSSLIITSDHGNIEDMSHGSHTCNPVPTLVWGPLKEAFSVTNNGFDLTHLLPALTGFLGRSS